MVLRLYASLRQVKASSFLPTQYSRKVKEYQDHIRNMLSVRRSQPGHFHTMSLVESVSSAARDGGCGTVGPITEICKSGADLAYHVDRSLPLRVDQTEKK